MTMPERAVESAELEEIAELALPLDNPTDLDALLDRVGDARYVLLCTRCRCRLRRPEPTRSCCGGRRLRHRCSCSPDDRDSPWLGARRGHRAIGVVYRPSAERRGNWVPTVMGRRYDAFCSFQTTEALQPLHLEAAQPQREHETYPWST